MHTKIVYSGGSKWGRGSTAPTKIGHNLAKLAPFLPILASMPPPLTDHPGSAPGLHAIMNTIFLAQRNLLFVSGKKWQNND